MQNFTQEDIGYVRAYLQRSPSDSLKKEADQVIGFLQSQVATLEAENKMLLKHNEDIVWEADNRVQSIADQLVQAQKDLQDHLLKASI